MRPLGYALAALAVATLIVIPTRPPEIVTVPAGPEPTATVTR